MKKLLFLLSIVFITVNSFGQVTATQLNNIAISDHPTKGLQRRADFHSFCWVYSDSFIAQTYRIYELDANGNRDPYSKYEVTLYASNAYLVNPTTGALLMTVDEYNALPVNERPANVMGEYTFFLLYAENDIKLYPLLLAKMHEADLVRQRFDR